MAVFMVIIDVQYRTKLGYLYFPNPVAWVMALLIAPLAAALSVELNIIISARATDVRSAQQTAALVVLPFAALYVLTEIGAVTLDVPGLLLVAAILVMLRSPARVRRPGDVQPRGDPDPLALRTGTTIGRTSNCGTDSHTASLATSRGHLMAHRIPDLLVSLVAARRFGPVHRNRIGRLDQHPWHPRAVDSGTGVLEKLGKAGEPRRVARRRREPLGPEVRNP